MKSRFAYLLDTDASSEPARPQPDPVFMAWLNEHAHETALSVFVLYERRRGIEALPLDTPVRRRQERAFRLLVRDFGEAILDFSTLDAWQAGQHFHVLTQAHGSAAVQHIGWVDFLIASQALAHQLRVVTRNVRHFPFCPTITPWSEHPPA